MLPAAVVRTLYRQLWRHARHYDRNPVLKAGMVRNPSDPTRHPSKPRSDTDTLHWNVWSDAFGSDALYYRPSTQFTSVVRKCFRSPDTSSSVQTRLEVGFSVLREMSAFAALAQENSALKAAMAACNAPVPVASSPSSPSSDVIVDAKGRESRNQPVLWATPLNNVLAPGVCLVSHPALYFTHPHPSLYFHFHRAVVLLTQRYPNGGWRGVVINKPFPFEVTSAELFRSNPNATPSTAVSYHDGSGSSADRELEAARDLDSASTNEGADEDSDGDNSGLSHKKGAAKRRRRTREVGQAHIDLVRVLFSASELRFGGPVGAPLQYIHRITKKPKSTVATSIETSAADALKAYNAIESSGKDGMRHSTQLTDSLFWGFDNTLGNFMDMVRNSGSGPSLSSATAALSKAEVRAVGKIARKFAWFAYEASWSPGQLERALKSGADFPVRLSDDLLFSPVTNMQQGDQLWVNVLKLMGEKEKEYGVFAHFPDSLGEK